MLQKKLNRNNFAKSLKTIRKARGLNQEAFSLVSSRTYVSSLERGLKTPTISKVDELAGVMDIHPLSLLTLSYLKKNDNKEITSLMDQISKDLHAILDLK